MVSVYDLPTSDGRPPSVPSEIPCPIDRIKVHVDASRDFIHNFDSAYLASDNLDSDDLESLREKAEDCFTMLASEERSNRERLADRIARNHPAGILFG